MMVERAGAGAPVTVDEVIDGLVAPIIYRVIFLPWTLSESFALERVATLFESR